MPGQMDHSPLSVPLKGRIGYAGEHLLWQWGYQLRKRKALGQMLCSAADDGQGNGLQVGIIRGVR